ncbi:MAG: class I SAM-dependent methyltransferase [Candidatus Verstraetearchaeota archaeon]|nr:class I SAM-dependent methyltransferase [Candidatus Verstraetearchaeota archaeon]
MFYDVPFVSSPEMVVRRMLKLAQVKPGEIVYDLGAGDGRILFIAAREFGARAVGVEIRHNLVEQIKIKINKYGLNGKVRIIEGNFFDVDISEADVVTMYLLTSVNERLKPKLERELKNGVRIVSHDFEVPGWNPVRVDVIPDIWTTHKIYLYVK